MINIYFHVIDPGTNPILKILRNLRNQNIKLWFNTSDNKEAINFIKDKSLIEYRKADNGLGCYLWNILDTETVPLYNNDGLFHLVSRYTSDKTNFVCIDSKEYAKNQLVLFQDAIHKGEYPKDFIKIPCYKDWNSLFLYLKNKGLFSFSLTDLKSATKLFSVLLASKRPLITELADKLRLKYPLLPTISPCPTMRLEAIRSIIPISCRRYPKSV